MKFFSDLNGNILPFIHSSIHSFIFDRNTLDWDLNEKSRWWRWWANLFNWSLHTIRRCDGDVRLEKMEFDIFEKNKIVLILILVIHITTSGMFEKELSYLLMSNAILNSVYVLLIQKVWGLSFSGNSFCKFIYFILANKKANKHLTRRISPVFYKWIENQMKSKYFSWS